MLFKNLTTTKVAILFSALLSSSAFANKGACQQSLIAEAIRVESEKNFECSKHTDDITSEGLLRTVRLSCKVNDPNQILVESKQYDHELDDKLSELDDNQIERTVQIRLSKNEICTIEEAWDSEQNQESLINTLPIIGPEL